jgi:hypothetical protein
LKKNAKIQLKMLVCLNLTPFSKYEIKGKKHMKNYKDYVQQILKMKLENALTPNA